MRRILLLSALLVGIDQVSKTVAQAAFPATSLAEWRACRENGLDCVELLADVVIAPGWGLIYIVHPGLWLWTDAPLFAVYAAELFAVALWVGVVVAALRYRRWYRTSVPVDLAVAFLAATAFGNLIDRLLVGGARDWLATPVAVANFADVAGWGFLLLLAVSRTPGDTRYAPSASSP